MQTNKMQLKRKLGVTDLFSIGYGDLGSSIYYALGITAFFSLGAAPISLLLAGLVFVCTALTYAELTAALKDQGGVVNFSRIAFNDFISFIAGWGLLLDFIMTIAISIFSIYPYLAFSHGDVSPVLQLGVPIGLIGVLFLMNFFGAKHSTRVSIILTLLALGLQISIILIGILGDKEWMRVFDLIRVNQGPGTPSWPEFWKGTAMAMVAYTGIEAIASLGLEAKQPEKTLPRAVLIVMAVLILVYMGMSTVAFSLVSPEQLGGVYLNNPIAGIVAHLPFGSNLLTPVLGVLTGALLFVAGNAGLMGASRLAFNMGEFHQLPGFFYYTHKKYKTPIASLAIFAIFASVIILISRRSLHFLADLYNFGAMMAFCFAHCSLIVLRIKQPHLKRPFKVPLNIPMGKGVSIPFTAILGALSTFAVWILVVISKPEGRYLGCLWMIAGITMYLVYRKKYKMNPFAHAQSAARPEKITAPLSVQKVGVFVRSERENATIQMACEIAKIHGASLEVIHLIEVHHSLPLHFLGPFKEKMSKHVLMEAERMGKEIGIEVHGEQIKTRFAEGAILSHVIEKEIDLLVVGAYSAGAGDSQMGFKSQRLLKEAPCKVCITSHFA